MRWPTKELGKDVEFHDAQLAVEYPDVKLGAYIDCACGIGRVPFYKTLPLTHFAKLRPLSWYQILAHRLPYGEYSSRALLAKAKERGLSSNRS